MDQEDLVVDLKQRRGPSAIRGPPDENDLVLSRQQVYDFLKSEKDRVHACGTLGFTCAIWIAFTFSNWTHTYVEHVNRTQELLRHAVEEIEVETLVSVDGWNPVYKKLNIQNITTTQETWAWIADGFVPFMAGEPDQPGVVRSFNHVIRPGVQLRQKRVSGTTCPVSEGLADYFRSECRSRTSKPAAFGPMADVLTPNGTTDNAFIAGGGFEMAAMSWNEDPNDIFFAFCRIDRFENGTVKGAMRARELWQNGWMDDATDYVQVAATLLNPELAIMAHVTVKIEFVRGGRLKPIVDVRPLPLITWEGTLHILVDAVWGLLTLFLFILTLQEAMERKGSLGRRCCGHFFLLIDWTIILVGLSLLAFFMVYSIGIGALDEHLGKLPPALNEEVVTTTEKPPDALLASYQELAMNQRLAEEGWQAQFQEDLELLIAVKIYHRLGMFWYVALLMFRFFRGFAGQPRIAALGRTVAKAASDLAHLFICGFVAFANLALGGHVLFGAERLEWSSLRRSAMTTISFLFGQSDIPAMFEMAPISTVIWGLAYLVCIIIMLDNMITAILVDHHRAVRKTAGRAQPTLPGQIWTSIEDFAWKRAYDVRLILRFLKNRTAPEGTMRKLFPKLKPETKRIARIPYDKLIAFFTLEPDVSGNPPQPPWAPVTKEMIMDLGVDSATAARLMNKCKSTTTVNPQDEMPVMRLFAEFEGAMKTSCTLLDIAGEELKNWVSERKIDMQNMEPRQRKLEILSREIEKAEPMFGNEDAEYAAN